MTNTEKLEKAIRESGLRKSWIAERMGLSTYGFMRKVSNKNEFKTSEVQKLCEILSIRTTTERDEIFFANKVD